MTQNLTTKKSVKKWEDQKVGAATTPTQHRGICKG
jgi:hypothetical protein